MIQLNESYITTIMSIIGKRNTLAYKIIYKLLLYLLLKIT